MGLAFTESLLQACTRPTDATSHFMAFFKSAKISIIGSSKWLSFCRGYMLPSRNYRILKICLFLMPGITPGRLAHPLAADMSHLTKAPSSLGIS